MADVTCVGAVLSNLLTALLIHVSNFLFSMSKISFWFDFGSFLILAMILRAVSEGG